jgi:hypothetical protein
MNYSIKMLNGNKKKEKFGCDSNLEPYKYRSAASYNDQETRLPTVNSFI